MYCVGLQAKDNALAGIKVMPMPENRVRIDFQFKDPILQQPASFITQDPSRLVLDFINSINQLDSSQQTKKIEIGSLTNYKVASISNRVRIIMDLSGTVTYSGDVLGHVYSLIISGTGEQLISHRKEVFITNRKINAHFAITNIDFRGIDRQGGRVILDMSDTGVPVDIEKKGNEVIAQFMNTRLPPSLMKRYDVTDFHTPVQMVNAQQEGKNTRVTLFNKGGFGHFAYQVNKQFIIDVFPLTAEELQEEKLKKKVFIGKRISLNFQNIAVRAVLQLLADFTGVNIVVSDSVSGSITLYLNDVPWDQALDIILTTQGLDKRQVGNVILIDKATALVARESEELKEQVAARKLAPVHSDLIQINYAKAIDIATMLKDKTNSLLSERGTVSVDTRTNTIWLQDTDSQIEEVRALVKHLDIPVKQVVIEARIVDVTKNCEEDLGISWGVTKPTHLSGTLAGANQMQQGISPGNITPLSDRLNVDLAAAPIAALPPPASIGLALAKLGDGILLDLELSALESMGKAEIIASPRLMTTNQQSATISSGEDIPYQQATSSGATAVAFKKAVLSLKVTPQITPDGKLLMDLLINQDANSGQLVNGVPIILTKSIQTNVLVNNGQTIVLGGIYTQNQNNQVTRVPFLGSVPIIKNLFNRTRVTSNNEELLIFITPRIIANSLSLTAIEGTSKRFPEGIELDKFGKPEIIPPRYMNQK